MTMANRDTATIQDIVGMKAAKKEGEPDEKKWTIHTNTGYFLDIKKINMDQYWVMISGNGLKMN